MSHRQEDPVARFTHPALELNPFVQPADRILLSSGAAHGGADGVQGASLERRRPGSAGSCRLAWAQGPEGARPKEVVVGLVGPGAGGVKAGAFEKNVGIEWPRRDELVEGGRGFGPALSLDSRPVRGPLVPSRRGWGRATTSYPFRVGVIHCRAVRGAGARPRCQAHGRRPAHRAPGR